VPRVATTSDVFNAVAESRRRDILVYLASRERPVDDIVSALALGQPSVSKHLRCSSGWASSMCGGKDVKPSIAPTSRPSSRSLTGLGTSSACGSINSHASKRARRGRPTPTAAGDGRISMMEELWL
jgi:DNA-binding transcriptional ArsR family regulator